MTLAQTRRPDRAWLVTLVLLSLAFALFFVLPFAGMLNRGLRHRETWDIITSESALTALRLSLWTSTVTVILAIGFGTPLAYLMAHASFRGKSIVDALIDLPIVLPPTVAGVALLTAFGRRGLIGSPI
ncbi:MAG: molybdate ABC transporter permease subunit, partial [Tepidiformaceae bacterium]